MYLIYNPEGQDEPIRWRYNPKRMMSVEREDIEKRTNRNFSQFTTDVLQGNSLCRRALLFTYLRRDHPKTRWEDVDFAWDELTLEYSKQEWKAIRDEVMTTKVGDELADALAGIDRHMAEAHDEPTDEGKAELPIAG
ncbi:hypothetical protein [Streptomyces sp. NPDC094032]|uniref:hypothetical protein n=1 Tax=Streptomyces sp. NPDC094032 TaxID=3155308 RepID=UPI003327A13B